MNFHDLFASNKINKDSILFDTNHKSIYNKCTYCKEEELPCPLEEAKLILRKLDEGEFFGFLSQDNHNDDFI